ncbi:MAG: hypothetical protein GYB35_14970 [Algicola sp.]|nr:hypothetical protein [Algicola sp.]
MMYNNYIKKISDRFESRFNEIDPEWNFDIGNEFEVELATLIDELLPDKFGVCRGFVTPMNGLAKGDDIIIYDKMNAPLVKPPNSQKFARKEYVPLEATYAYIEAKNTIELKNKNANTYIGKAIKQVADIKKLKRRSKPLSEIVRGADIQLLNLKNKIGKPKTLNPMFTAIIGRGVRINGKLETDIIKIKENLPDNTGDYGPDLIILGPNISLAPFYIDEQKTSKTFGINYESPFCIDDRHEMIVYQMTKMAYGFGLCSLLYALDYIKLDNMPWNQVLGETFKVASSVKES